MKARLGTSACQKLRVWYCMMVAALFALTVLPAYAAEPVSPRPRMEATDLANSAVSPSSNGGLRKVIGEPNRVALATQSLTRPDIAQQLKSLNEKAIDRGTVRLIVGVRVPFAAEGVLVADQVPQQRAEIRTKQTEVLQSIPALATKQDKIHNFEFIPFMAVEADSDDLASLAKHPDVNSIEEDQQVEPTLAQSSPLIGATASHSSYTGNGKVVAVLDTGVDKSHPFLSGKVVSEACFSSYYALDGSTSVCPGGVTSSTASGSGVNCSVSGCEHGTHVAGIIAGSNSSFTGVAPGAGIIAIQVFSLKGTGGITAYQGDILKGLERVYALRNTYSIAAVNMSLGGGRYYSQTDCDIAWVSVKAAIDNLRAANIASVISSGNKGYSDSISGPACISSAVSVGSTWDTAPSSSYTFFEAQCTDSGGVDKVACYSNSISFLNLLAPGSLINSSIPGGAYANFNGTSMAAPQVAGAFALLKQKNSGLTVAQGLNALASTGLSVTDARNGLVKPRIRINSALASVSSSTPVTFSLTVNRTGTGAGTVTATGINCGVDCTEAYNSGSLVTLTATAAVGSVFTGWSGDCTGTSLSCAVSMNGAKSVIATFALITSAQPDLVVTSATASASGFSGGIIDVSFTLKNQGVISSPASWLGILASTNNIISPLDIDTGWGCNMLSLIPGDSQVCSGIVKLPNLETGSYYIGAYADYGNAIVESNETNNGRAPASPTVIQLDPFPFDGHVPAGWAQPSGSSVPWLPDSVTYFAGGYSLKSGYIGNGQKSGIAYTASFPSGTISFAVKVSSEANYDYLRFYIDGILKGEWSGEQDWLFVSYPVTSGSHQVKWQYEKDNSLSEGDDAAWIDTVIFPPGMTPGAPTITRLIPGNSSMQVFFTPPTSSGGSVITRYTAYCTGNGSTLSTYGTTSPLTVTGLTNGVSYACSVTALNGAGMGAASVSLTKAAGRRSIAPILNILLN